MAKTRRANVQFRVTERGDGTFWIVVEALSGDRLTTFNRRIGFDLKPGTTLEQANDVATYLGNHLNYISEMSLGTSSDIPW